jgi:hypothetical protein
MRLIGIILAAAVIMAAVQYVVLALVVVIALLLVIGGIWRPAETAGFLTLVFAVRLVQFHPVLALGSLFFAAGVMALSPRFRS